MRLFIESDFAGVRRTMRLRHAFLQTNRFVVGQTWSTFSNPEADPIGIDFEGLNAIHNSGNLCSVGRQAARGHATSGHWHSRIQLQI